VPEEFGRGAITPETARLIRDEHAQLHTLLRDIQGVQDIAALLPQLEKLYALLVVHFEHEETPNAFGYAVAEPRLEERAQGLFREHEAFLGTVTELIDRARACLDAPRAVFRGVADLARQLHEHEDKENALMLDLAETDLGGGD
jgi:hypothetical protein